MIKHWKSEPGTVYLFAKDCLIYCTIHSEINHTILQNDLNIVLILGHTSGKWNLMFQNVRIFRFLNVQEVFSHCQIP